MIHSSASHILNFWFGDPNAPESGYGQQRRMWFLKDKELDQQIRKQFLGDYEQVRQGHYADWQDQPKTALALIILLDQFPRNMFRGSPRSFEADSQALQVAKAAIVQRYDQSLLPIERIFIYLPFGHSERLVDQNQAVALFEALVQEEPDLQSSLDYAYQHRDVIARFGRFPHRNEILNRASTPEEQAFLQKPGSRF